MPIYDIMVSIDIPNTVSKESIEKLVYYLILLDSAASSSS